MKKQMYIALFTALFLFIVFAASVFITEETNIKYLQSKYSTNSEIKDSMATSLAVPSDKAIQFQKNKTIMWLLRLALSILIPLIFLFSRLSAGIRNRAQTKGKSIILGIALYYLAYTLIVYIIALPLDYYSGFIRLHNYGLSNQSFGKWLGDSLKSQILDSIIGAAILWIPYLIIKKSPKRWWLYIGLLSIPALSFMMFLSPILIDPIFNKYEPINNKQLEVKIYEQLERTSIGDCQVYQINKSVDTKQMNAYMTGIFNTKRIVLWDTTVEGLTEKETLAVVAHEMGHYLMGHIWKSIILGGFLTIFILYLINKSALWILDKSNGKFGFTKLYDIASLPLLILLINLFMFASNPVINGYSRHIEKDADRFELELTHDNYSTITSTIKLHQESLTLPRPGIIYELWNYDHPTFEDRVEFAKDYKPWDEGKVLKYDKYFIK